MLLKQVSLHLFASRHCRASGASRPRRRDAQGLRGRGHRYRSFWRAVDRWLAICMSSCSFLSDFRVANGFRVCIGLVPGWVGRLLAPGVPHRAEALIQRLPVFSRWRSTPSLPATLGVHAVVNHRLNPLAVPARVFCLALSRAYGATNSAQGTAAGRMKPAPGLSPTKTQASIP